MALHFNKQYSSAKTKIKVKRSVFLALLVLLFIAVFSLTKLGKVQAACVAPATDFGAATKTINVPTAGTYRVWSRIMAPNPTANSYTLEVDGVTCIAVGDAPIATNVWTWVDYRDASSASKVSVTLGAGSHTFKMIGREASVKLDLLLLTADTACVPTGAGSNCVVVADTIPPTVALTAPTAGQTISGVNTLTANATDSGGVSKVEFYLGLVLVGSATSAPYSFELDTTKYPNGSVVIGAKSYDTAGNSSTANSSVTATISNPVATQVDLVVTSVTASPAAPVAGQQVTFTAVVKNQGTTASTLGVNHGVRFSVDGQPVTWVGNNADVQIAPGQSMTFVANNGLTGTPYWLATEGSRQISTMVDDQNLIVETDETNNTLATSLTVSKPPDTQAPSVPSGLNASAINATRVNLSWTASTDDVGVAGYWVSRNGVAIAKLVGTPLSYSDTNVAPSTAYSYSVAAYDVAGNSSAYSTAVSVTTPALLDTTAPSAPTALSAAPASQTQINLSWTASTDNVGVTGYDIYRATSSSATTKIASVTTTSYGNTGLTASTAYTYYVIARDAANLQSVQSTSVSATTLASNPTAYGSISGIVKGKYLGNPLPRVTVVIYVGSVRYSYSTNSKGQYSISNLPPGQYTLTFSDRLRRPRDFYATVYAGNNTILNVTF